MDRSRIVQALDGLYGARLQGDVAACVAGFAPDGVFRMANLRTPDGQPMQAEGHEQLTVALTMLVDTWRWEHQHLDSVLIEGACACVRYRVTLEHRPTGEMIETEMMDHVTLDGDYRATMFAQFVDTALVVRLSAPQ